MAVSYTLKPGETLALIAQRHGLRDERVIYDFLVNAPLRSNRRSPADVTAGDAFMIPDRTAANSALVELCVAVTDSVSGGVVSGITFELDVPDGVSRKRLSRDAAIGRMLATNPDLTAGDVTVLGLVDKSEPIPLRYALSSPHNRLRTDRCSQVSIPDRRRVATAVASASRIRRRWDWGKLKPSYAKMERDWDYTTVVVHHSGNSGEKDPVAIEARHMGTNKWDDIGYHYLIPPSGEVYEGRYLAFKGSHVDNANTGKIGILIMGDFEPQVLDVDDEPTAAQLDSAINLVLALKRHFSLVNLGGHKDYKHSTECPGEDLYKLVPDLRKRTGLGGP